MCYNVETLQFYLGDIAEPFEGIDLIIVSIFETKGLALLATSFGNYALEDSLFTLLIMCHMCCGAFAFLMVSCQRTKNKRLLRWILEPYSLSVNMSIIYLPLLFS